MSKPIAYFLGLIAILWMPTNSQAQEETAERVRPRYRYEASSAVSLGFRYQRTLGGELNLHIGWDKIEHRSGEWIRLDFPRVTQGLFAGIAPMYNPVRRNFNFGAHIGYEYHHEIGLTGRMRFSYHSDTRQNDLRLMPEIGYNFLGALIITYGYAIPLRSETIEGLSRHQLSLSLRLPLD